MDPTRGCLSICPYNLMGHNKDVVSYIHGVCDIPYLIEKKVFDALSFFLSLSLSIYIYIHFLKSQEPLGLKTNC